MVIDAMGCSLRAWFAVTAGAALALRAGTLPTAGALLSLGCVLAVISIFTDLPVAPPVATIAEATLFVLATSISIVASRHREACVRSRFEQHLAPAVVRRILERPGLPKLSGERREVTALFTDVEGFTAMTHQVDPAILVNTLDGYFEGMTTIIIAHGGMIDKIVGDAVHALFNAPNDLKDHPRKAIDCAIALRSWSELFRHCPEAAKIGFGRTRIGVETGLAIVGDVGIRTKLDYTAHGDAVNIAARLEAANKELGSSICIGPVAASRYDESLLRPLGRIVIRGCNNAITVFEPSNSSTPTSSGQTGVPAVSSVWRESWRSRLLPRPRCLLNYYICALKESGGDQRVSPPSRMTILRSQDPRLCLRQMKDLTGKKVLSQ
jgi:adenylate cyclase